MALQEDGSAVTRKKTGMLKRAFDEMHGFDDGLRKAYQAYDAWLKTTHIERLVEKHQ